MKLTQEKPKFLPMTLTFETAEEWNLFHELIIASEAKNTLSNCKEINEMIWNIHQLIMQGLVKV